MSDSRWWLDYAIECIHTGSRVICNPPPTNTDDDYMLLVDQDLVEKFEARLLEDGFTLGGSMKYTRQPKPLEAYPSCEDIKSRTGNVFHSYKKGDLNLIVTCSPDYYKNFAKATMLARELNLIKKEQRISVFECICCDIWPDFPGFLIKRIP